MEDDIIPKAWGKRKSVWKRQEDLSKVLERTLVEKKKQPKGKQHSMNKNWATEGTR